MLKYPKSNDIKYTVERIENKKISDFGLSREKKQEGSMTMTLGGICNPRWRPPEITKNLAHYSEKVDVYSFALIVWEMLTGEIPYANLDGPQVLLFLLWPLYLSSPCSIRQQHKWHILIYDQSFRLLARPQCVAYCKDAGMMTLNCVHVSKISFLYY